jgi:hypothetical protein
MTYKELIESIIKMIDTLEKTKKNTREEVTLKVFEKIKELVLKQKMNLNDYRVLLYYFSIKPDAIYKEALKRLKDGILEENGIASYMKKTMEEGSTLDDAKKKVYMTYLESYLKEEIPFETLETALWALDINLKKEYYLLSNDERRKELKTFFHLG